MNGNQNDQPVDGCCLGCLMAPVAFILLSAMFGPLIGFLGSVLVAYMASSPNSNPDSVYPVDDRDPPS